MYFGNDIEYDNLEDYLLNGYTTWNINDLFNSEEEFIEAQKNNFLGSYTFSIIYSKFKQVDYKFVFIGQFEEDPNLLRLIPIELPDDKLFNYWNRYDSEGNIIESDNTHLNGFLTIRYTPYSKSRYELEDDELITFEGEIREIQEEDFYMIHNGLKYQILEPQMGEDNKPITETHIPYDYFYIIVSPEEFKNNNYTGKIERTFIRNTGEIYTENYIITNHNEECVFIKYEKDSIPLSLYTPQSFYKDDRAVLIIEQIVYDTYYPY